MHPVCECLLGCLGVGLKVRNHRSRKVVHQSRVFGISLLACSLCLPGIWIVTFEQSIRHEPYVRVVLLVVSLCSVAFGLRVWRMGTFIDDVGVRVGQYFRTYSFRWDDVADFRTEYHRGGGAFPALITNNGRVIGIPMLERGIVSELRSPQSQWGKDLDYLCAELRKRKYGGS